MGIDARIAGEGGATARRIGAKPHVGDEMASLRYVGGKAANVSIENKSKRRIVACRLVGARIKSSERTDVKRRLAAAGPPAGRKADNLTGAVKSESVETEKRQTARRRFERQLDRRVAARWIGDQDSNQYIIVEEIDIGLRQIHRAAIADGDDVAP